MSQMTKLQDLPNMPVGDEQDLVAVPCDHCIKGICKDHMSEEEYWHSCGPCRDFYNSYFRLKLWQPIPYTVTCRICYGKGFYLVGRNGAVTNIGTYG